MLRGIYVHIPFCVKKCGYCDFVSYPLDGGAETEGYAAALLGESRIYARILGESPALGQLPFESLYFGGGTPTCLSGGQLCYVLQELLKLFPFKEDAEITIEGNPGTIDLDKLQELRRAGFNRLSLGAQSFNSGELAVLDRIHSVPDIKQAFGWARQAGFANIGLDLMYGLPGQSLDNWRSNLQAALELKPEHLSLYQLKIEEGTPFYDLWLQGKLAEFPDELAAEMYEEAIDTLVRAGYHHYEISNFALPGRESRHNQIYWRNEEYLGLGAGASGYLGNVRYRNETSLWLYRSKVGQGIRPVEDEEVLSPELVLAEGVFLGLRLVDGLDKQEFFQRYGVKIGERYGETISRLKGLGLLQEDEQRLALTRQGLKLANLVFMEFLP